MVYLISYDINTTVKNYEPLYDAIKSLSAAYQHPLESTWFVDVNMPVNDIYDKLQRHLHPQDHIVIIEITSNAQGWMNKSFWDWFKEHVL